MTSSIPLLLLLQITKKNKKISVTNNPNCPAKGKKMSKPCSWPAARSNPIKATKSPFRAGRLCDY